ncbi:uncharacterized protein [Malus domestica]|uniref:uncharacterized protein n=1 Tax=Malus domestica TaxID=3750 RepID=UPI003976263E
MESRTVLLFLYPGYQGPFIDTRKLFHPIVIKQQMVCSRYQRISRRVKSLGLSLWKMYLKNSCRRRLWMKQMNMLMYIKEYVSLQLQLLHQWHGSIDSEVKCEQGTCHWTKCRPKSNQGLTLKKSADDWSSATLQRTSGVPRLGNKR